MNEEMIPKLSMIQEQVLKRAMVMLDGLKCPYAIVDPLGNKHGTLVVVAPTKRSSERKHPHGEKSEYVAEHIRPMKVGDVVAVPYGKYSPAEVQRSSHSFANKLWKAGCITTTMNHKQQHLEIMRVI